MSDKPTPADVEQGIKIRKAILDIVSTINILEGVKDYPDLRHARTKLHSAERGLDDFISKGSS
jgi:hypothetical protein